VVKAFVVLIAAWAAYLAWTIVLAASVESVFVAGPRMARDPWTWVTIVDVYLGFVAFGAFIVARERRAARYLPWLAGVFVLGNVVSAVYLAWVLARHGFDLVGLVTGAPAPTPGSRARPGVHQAPARH
jgi:hypothetical protein